MELKVKTFTELTTYELYEILRARETVFLLEQRVVCQDKDRADYDALHCILEENGSLVAYLRACPTENGVKLGRVLSLRRGEGLGSRLMEGSIPEIMRHFNTDKLYIHAQKHAEGFYSRHGFVTTSPEFDEEGVPHVSMSLICSEK